MDIKAQIKDVKYTPFLTRDLKSYSKEEFLNGKAFKDSTFLLNYKNNRLAVSCWVSPKRTRSYPFARVYDTMDYKNRVTIIPVIKDEGLDGDRDFLQWDTISLMSLLGVNVILAYYSKANRSSGYKNKITNQQFDYKYLIKRIEELIHYQSDPIHWNMKELQENLQNTIDRSYHYCKKMSNSLGVKMHSKKGLERKIKKITSGVDKFMEHSRENAQSAQEREYHTEQPKESIFYEKAKITIRNFLGGVYYFTVDEVTILSDKVFLIEKKHTDKRPIPTLPDIKDGLIKMILYTNFSDVKVTGKSTKSIPVLGLTSSKFSGFATNIFKENKVREDEIEGPYSGYLFDLFEEADENNFYVFLINNKDEKNQDKILHKIIE